MSDSSSSGGPVRPIIDSTATDFSTASESIDMDFEPSTEESNNDVDDDEDEDEDDDDGDFLQRLLTGGGGDEDGAIGEIEVEFDDPGDQEGDDTETERTALQRRQVLRMLANSELGRLFRFAGDDDFGDDDEDEGGQNNVFRISRRQRPDPNRFPKVPSDEGQELMKSGTFGSNEVQTVDPGNLLKKKKLARRILDRELATEGYTQQRINQRLMAQGMLPASKADMIIHYNQPVYSGQFSDDGNFFFSANKDFKVRMYDTSNPYKWRYYKTVEYPFGQWTLTDASLSPDNRFVAYTSIRNVVCLAPTDPNDLGDPYNLDFSEGIGRATGFHRRFDRSFGIWSIRFSGDGQKLVAGATGGSILVYDIESRRTLHRIFGHDEDVNAVCFADSSSPHILYSGSDDTTLKVWDTRSMGDSRAAGAFIGHIEGLTYIDSKGDGRYILSNGKDQSMKLWDLRMVMSARDYHTIGPNRRRATGPHFDYRWGEFDDDDWYEHPNDNSLVTFRGHRVMRTLIRCHFSPPGSTNSRYVYSGSEDGKVYIWNMDATLAGKIDVYSATKNTRPPHREYGMMEAWDDGEDYSQSRWKTCVRDASWHPNAPMIVASAWNGYGMGTGTCTVHSWNDEAEEDEAEPKMGFRVDPKLHADPALYVADTITEMPRRRGLRGMRGY